MRKAKKKSFNWYGMKQHFSIRKYHFGAASVLLGMSLVMGAGAQTVKAEETAASSDATTASSTSVDSLNADAKESVALPTETAASSERTVEVSYIVQYVLADGSLVNATVASASVTTTDALASTDVTVNAAVPAGYELAADQAATVTQTVTENGENIITVTVAPVATETAEVAPTEAVAATETTTETPATTEVATVTPAVPTTVEEAKVVLEQVISEAEVLATEGNRLVVADSSADTSALAAAAAATQLVATESTQVLNDSAATLDAVNAQIDTVRSSVEALALELRKYLGTEDIQVVLATTSTNLQNIGDAEGVLIETGTTATPDMSDPNGASVTSKVSGTLKPTENADYLTVQYTPVAYFDAVAPVYSPFKENGGKSTGGAYFRTSVKPSNLYGKLLVELVASDGTVVETKEVEPNTAVEFDYYKTSHGAGYPFVYTYDPDYDSEDMFGVIRIQWAYNTMSAVSQKLTRPITNTTVYQTEDGQQLATYTVLTTPDLNTTPSEKREFKGYTYKETTTTTSNVVLVPSEPYVEVTRFATNAVQFKTIVEAVGTDGTVKKTYYIADPNYTGTHSFTDTNLDGFLAVLETDPMPIGSSNTNLKLLPSLLDSGYKIYRVDASTELIYPDKEGDKQPTPIRGTLITDASELDFSTLTSSTQWFHIKFSEKQDGTLAFVRMRPATLGVAARIAFEYDMRDNDGSTTNTGTNLGVRTTSWKGMTHTITLTNAAQTITTTTHIYTPIPQEAIIRYQVEGSTDYLEDSGTLTGNPGTDITYSAEDTINKYKKFGYELVSDNFTTDAGQNYDYDSTVKQEFLVVIKPRVVDVPKEVTPGDPVDPTDPNSPVWPDTVENLERTQEVTRTVEYKYEDGTPVRVDAAGNILPKDSTEGTPLVKTQTVTFTRPAQVNLVTGEITYGEWSADSTDVLSGNLIPEIIDYTATRTTLEGADAPMTETVKDKTVAATDADINEVVYFKENPKYGDVVVNYVNTDGKVIATPVVDTNDALVGTDYSTADRVPEKIVEDTTGDVYYYKEIKAEDAAKETGKVVEGTTEVTYVYEQAGNVVVNYTLADGTVIKDPVNDETNAKPGSPYDTKDNKPETITTTDGKVYKLVPAATIGNETGDVEAGKTTEVTYIYEEVVSDVVVEYYDTEGNVIAKTVTDTDDASVGTVYNTDEDNRPATITTDDGTVYYYQEVKDTSAPTTGKVAETTTTVQYVYEKAGNVVVNYIAEDGTVIKQPVNDETNAKPGTEYNTTDNKPTTITTEDGKTYELIPTATVGTENGTVEAGKTTEVTYVYKEVKGSVVVNYVTTDGTVLQAPVTDTPETSTGTPYDTTDVKPETITTADGKTYKLVPALTKGSETGDVVPGVTEVTYVYEEVKGDVVVNYVNTDGKVIATPVVDTKATSTGTAYDTTDNKPEKIIEDATGDVYYYKEVQAGSNETGKVVEGTTEVTYVYEKAGNVVVNYITEDGTVIKTPVNDETNAKPGSPYDTTDNKPKTITTEDGTTYELVRTDGNENGSVEGGKTTEVTYVYRKVEAPVAKTGNVVVEYYNTDGEKIAADVEDTPETAVGTVYETLDYKPTTITKDGVKYYYKEVKATSATEKGIVSEGTTTVQYVYEPGGSVTVNYVTTDGAVIKSPVKDEENAEPGKSYTTEDNKPTTITTEDGKTYKLVPNATTGDENGTITSGEDKQVTYVYEEVKGNVVVNYIDTEGNVIKTPVEDTKSVSTGTAYDTTDNKPTTITTEDGTEYKLVPVLTKGEETGKVVEGTTQVTYVYQKVTTPAPKPNGSVVVNYVNTNGETIATSVNDTTDAKLDTPYDTTDYKPAIIKHDGVTYYYKEVKSGDSETGNVVEGTTEVTYIYEPGGSVTVNYVTTDGTVIKSPVKDEENAEPGKSYTTEDNKPTTITTEDGKTYKLVPNATTGDENGTITSGEDKQVTYVYEEVKGNVVVNYIDTEGNVIKTPVEDTKSASTGTAYDTTDNKPTTITTEDGTVYEIVPVLTIGSESGSVVEGTTQVTYVYRKVPTPTPAVKNGTVVVNYVTEDGTVIKSPVTDTPTSPEGTSYDTTDNKPTEITTEDGSRYVLIPSKTIGSENGTVVEGETVVTYVYKKVANWIPQIPSTPENPTPVNPVIPYPFDPTNPDKPVDPTTPGTNGEVPNIPYVPGYTPVDPKDNTPLKPVDPNDPGKGYVPPTPDETGKDTPIPYVQNGNVVVNYVTEDGTVIKSPVNDETDAPAGKSYDTTDNKPTEIVTEDGSRYVLIPSKTIGTENGTVEGGKTTEITYVYKKVANWIPEIPGVPENERPVVPYPFDPNNPDVPVTPNPGTVIPNVPGYTPVDPKDNTPLKPVDPNDPGKGYVPPTPDETGKDTPIPYVQNGNVVVNYVTEDGTVIKSPVNDETDAPAGKSYDTTDNKPTTITTEDGKTYELVRVDGSENGTVVGGKTTEVTYVYRKVETPTKKVVTNHVDEEGNPIAPQEEGTTPDKSIPGYEFTGKTITDEDGNTTHIYKKTPTKTVITKHVDEEGNPVAPQEDGTTPNKSIPGYEYVRTVVDVEGNTTHIYRKVSNKPTPPATETPVKPQPATPTPTADKAKQLPNTGEASSSAGVLGAAMLVAAIALAGKRRRNED
ncbi:MucBP domain-containing protein [Streptococcus suis]|uniref:MucBP domain-containing protein n=3 Tax=Streptococcus suis TaxID=1307 RepID=UPI00192DF9C5|nr:MucBP domain-containing protein [Streptococcus suis]MBL6439600.1 MucBP domain-containing protein [Streptococcus suis]